MIPQAYDNRAIVTYTTAQDKLCSFSGPTRNTHAYHCDVKFTSKGPISCLEHHRL